MDPQKTNLPERDACSERMSFPTRLISWTTCRAASKFNLLNHVMQGYIAHKTQPPPRHVPTVGS